MAKPKKQIQEKPIQLGHEVEDIVNGVKGHVIAMSEWLTGCDTAVVEPHSKDGAKQDGIVTDINRLKYIGEGVRPKFFPPDEVKEEVLKPVKEKKEPGGPHGAMKHPNHV